MAKKYIDADQLKAEIERLKCEAKSNLFIFNEEGGINSAIWRRQKIVCEKLISFIDTLQEQPVEGLEEAAGEYATKWHKRPDGSEWKCIFPKGAIRDFIAGAEWMKDKMTVHIPSVWREEDIKKSPSMCSWASLGDDGKYEYGEKYYDADGNEITKEEYEALVRRPTD